MDGVKLQDFPLQPSDSFHWLVNEFYCRGSCILTLEQFKNACFHIDSWTGSPVCQEDDTIENGLSLDVDRTIGYNYTLSNPTSQTQFLHHLWFVVQRTLTIKGNMIGLM